MKFSVGYRLSDNNAFLDKIVELKDSISRASAHEKSVEARQIGGARMITSELIKRKALEFGASDCGIGGPDIFVGEDMQKDKQIQEAKCWLKNREK